MTSCENAMQEVLPLPLSFFSSFIYTFENPSGRCSNSQVEQHFWSLVELFGQTQTEETLEAAGDGGGEV